MAENQNNVDLSIQLVRQLQSMLFDRDKSTNDLFEQTNLIIEKMNLARREINTNYEDISRKLTEELNNGSSN